MSTPQKKENRANAALPKTPQNQVNEVEVTFVKHAANKPRTDIRNLPYSKEGKGEILLMSKGKRSTVQDTSKTKAKKAGTTPAGKNKNIEDLDEVLIRTLPVLLRLRKYAQYNSNNKLSNDELQTLNELLIKAIAPSAEIVGLPADKIDEIGKADLFENLPDAAASASAEFIDQICADTTTTLGLAISGFMYIKGYKNLDNNILEEFYAENNLPPLLLHKGDVLCHIYCTELVHRGINPIQLIYKLEYIFKLADSSAIEILDLAQAALQSFEDEAL